MQHGSMDTTSCRKSAQAQLNICDDVAVNRLCAALNCRPTDIYQAVAYVGDRICCVREYVRQSTAPDLARSARINLYDLPPMWEH